MLANWETENLCRGLKAESVAAKRQLVFHTASRARLSHCHVMREDSLLLQGEILENVWLECIRNHDFGYGGQLWGFDIGQR